MNANSIIQNEIEYLLSLHSLDSSQLSSLLPKIGSSFSFVDLFNSLAPYFDSKNPNHLISAATLLSFVIDKTSLNNLSANELSQLLDFCLVKIKSVTITLQMLKSTFSHHLTSHPR